MYLQCKHIPVNLRRSEQLHTTIEGWRQGLNCGSHTQLSSRRTEFKSRVKSNFTYVFRNLTMYFLCLNLTTVPFHVKHVSERLCGTKALRVTHRDAKGTLRVWTRCRRTCQNGSIWRPGLRTGCSWHLTGPCTLVLCLFLGICHSVSVSEVLFHSVSSRSHYLWPVLVWAHSTWSGPLRTVTGLSD